MIYVLYNSTVPIYGFNILNNFCMLHIKPNKCTNNTSNDINNKFYNFYTNNNIYGFNILNIIPTFVYAPGINPEPVVMFESDILLERYCKTINTKIIAIIFGVIYVLGYPLNAWISGFHYLMLGILYVQTILYIVKEREDINFDYTLITMLLLNFGLILSYSLFCPFVYLAQFIYYIIPINNSPINANNNTNIILSDVIFLFFIFVYT